MRQGDIEKRRHGFFGKIVHNMLSQELQYRTLLLFACVVMLVGLSAININAQEPKPGPARTLNIPAIKETKLKNGLTVAVVEKRNVPLVTVQLLLRSGANAESMENAGLADITASMLTKGTKTRTAEQIAEEIEFLGGSIFSGAGWNNSSVTVSVTKDKLDKAIAILADVVLNPTFPQSELDLLKSQAIDGLTYNLTQPGFLGSYVASAYSFKEHPIGGTPQSIEKTDVAQVRDFYARHFAPQNSVLIFAGDVTASETNLIAQRVLGNWKSGIKYEPMRFTIRGSDSNLQNADPDDVHFLIIDLPNSGQASVTYQKNIEFISRVHDLYYPAIVLNSLLGGGYSSRLNQEIRIKRGLSYGAGSSFGWRNAKSNFSTRTQTKNESAPEVAELVLAEIQRLTVGETTAIELEPRKSVLTGDFGRNIETTGGLANALADLYTFRIPTTELNKYMTSVNSVNDKQMRELAKAHLLGGDIIIVGDYAKFKNDLAKRFPNIRPTIIPAAEVDITKPNLRK